MSTLSTTNLKNPSAGSNNIVLGTDGATALTTAKVTTLADSAGANTSTPAEIASGRAKAWVNFNGTGTVAIRASYNVSSITDNGVGDYTVNFTTAMADANYSTVCGNTVSIQATRSPESLGVHASYPPATSSVRVYNRLGGFSTSDSIPSDIAYANVAIFR
jgi:hypothetical protein